MKPLLSICIPTYNREKQLLENLKRILAQNCPEIEVLVCDNASTDGTEAAVRSFLMDNRLENFYYFKNETNIGPDRNFVKVLSLAKGTYSHLLGDDDFVRDDYLSKTLPVLKDHTFCYLSFSEGSSSCNME